MKVHARFSFVLAVCGVVSLFTPATLFAQFTFVGPSGGDFFDVLNWEDGGSANPAAIIDGVTGFIELDLTIGGTGNVAAASIIDFGAGSLSMTSGSVLNTSATMNFNSGSSLSMDGASLTLTGTLAAGELDLGLGSTLSVTGGSFLTAGDDMDLRGATSISDSTLESIGDDIEFKDDLPMTLTNSTFIVPNDPNNSPQVIFFEGISQTVINSNFTGGRISLDTLVTVTATDSVFNMVGDIEDAFSGLTNGTLILAGTSSVVADQVEEGATVILRDSSSLTLIDDNTDTDGEEWITKPSLTDSSVIFESTGASLTLQGGRIAATDDATQIINGLFGDVSYAANPSLFTPNNWNGQDDVTIQITGVPEPSSLVLASILAGSFLASCRSRRKSL